MDKHSGMHVAMGKVVLVRTMNEKGEKIMMRMGMSQPFTHT
jgi:hypothetical protein